MSCNDPPRVKERVITLPLTTSRTKYTVSADRFAGKAPPLFVKWIMSPTESPWLVQVTSSVPAFTVKVLRLVNTFPKVDAFGISLLASAR
jgi:hypothetical protein